MLLTTAGRRACHEPASSRLLPVFERAFAGYNRRHIAAALDLRRGGEDGTFVPKHFDKPLKYARSVYGGQILGQAVAAAAHTIDDKAFEVHSIHGYFIHGGMPHNPAEYAVQRTRDGRSFAHRGVNLTQQGRPVFSAQLSFHAPETSPLDHHSAMPDGIPAPETLHSRRSYLSHLADADVTKAKAIERIRHSQYDDMTPAFDIRYVDERDAVWWTPLSQDTARDPVMFQWVRCRDDLTGAHQSFHAAALAYASDAGIILPALLPLGTTEHAIAMITSVDHAMWFHSAFRADEWLLFELRSHRAAHGRALIRGTVYRQDGVLCASLMQEALIRWKGKPPARL